jgi:hypothetical protein
MDDRELMEEPGLEHYEGRHWLGWHQQVTLVSMAFAFLRSEQLRSKNASAATLTTCRRFASGSKRGWFTWPANARDAKRASRTLADT